MIRIVVDGVELRPPLSYRVDMDPLEPADAFTMTLPLDAYTVGVTRLDAPYQLFLDGTVIQTGWLQVAEETEDGQLILEGEDKISRLVTESIPGAGMSIANTTVEGAAKRIISPWFERVTFSNAQNRRLSRGRGRRARAGQEPALTAAQRRQIPRRFDAGTKRWEALMGILEPLRLTAWSSGDGKELVIASPNYLQEPQYTFIEELPRSNVLGMNRRKSIGERYSIIEVSGSGRPRDSFDPPFTPAYPGQRRPKYVNRNRIGVATDSTGDFQRDKRLMVVSEAMSQSEAQELASRMMGQGLVHAEQLRIRAEGHGQRRPGTSIRTLYTFDTVATVRRNIEAAPGNDRETSLVARDYWVQRVTMATDRMSGEVTELLLGPIGAQVT